MPEYLILIYDSTSYEHATAEQHAAITEGHRRLAQQYGPALRGGNALQTPSTATTLTPDGADGFTVTDGPFAETKEGLGGYYLVEVADLDEAIALAESIPLIGGSLEIRPIMVVGA